ncbi:MAG: AbrB/MazE/SpoVT family DNA-binding domain-containing protein [Opitutales bacterium]|nr:AbrB/MazE/SpoVT family DNA-binding domain-containing protein [Opitutales bacterium]
MKKRAFSESRRAALFRNGKSQAVRIPKAFEFEGDEVLIQQEEGCLVLRPVGKTGSLLKALDHLGPVSETFPDVDADLPPIETVNL